MMIQVGLRHTTHGFLPMDTPQRCKTLDARMQHVIRTLDTAAIVIWDSQPVRVEEIVVVATFDMGIDRMFRRQCGHRRGADDPTTA